MWCGFASFHWQLPRTTDRLFDTWPVLGNVLYLYAITEVPGYSSSRSAMNAACSTPASGHSQRRGEERGAFTLGYSFPAGASTSAASDRRPFRGLRTLVAHRLDAQQSASDYATLAGATLISGPGVIYLQIMVWEWHAVQRGVQQPCTQVDSGRQKPGVEQVDHCSGWDCGDSGSSSRSQVCYSDCPTVTFFTTA